MVHEFLSVKLPKCLSDLPYCLLFLTYFCIFSQVNNCPVSKLTSMPPVSFWLLIFDTTATPLRHGGNTSLTSPEQSNLLQEGKSKNSLGLIHTGRVMELRNRETSLPQSTWHDAMVWANDSGRALCLFLRVNGKEMFLVEDRKTENDYSIYKLN